MMAIVEPWLASGEDPPAETLLTSCGAPPGRVAAALVMPLVDGAPWTEEQVGCVADQFEPISFEELEGQTSIEGASEAEAACGLPQGTLEAGPTG